MARVKILGLKYLEESHTNKQVGHCSDQLFVDKEKLILCGGGEKPLTRSPLKDQWRGFPEVSRKAECPSVVWKACDPKASTI